MKELIHKNVLPNTYIPYKHTDALSRLLMSVSKESLFNKCKLWLKLKNTQPPTPKDSLYTQQTINKKILKDIESCESDPAYSKRNLITKILTEWWFNGLNLLQLAQIDCQSIIDRPHLFSWIYSVIKDVDKNLVSISLNPKEFLDNLISKLSKVYFNYIYICKHPNLPIILIRIQIFDLNLALIRKTLKVNTVSTKPYIFAIPLNSPNIIHSLGNDLVHDIVRESIERSLPQNLNNLLRMETPEGQTPIASLESIFLLKGGNSRFSNSLGIWTPYADGTVDMLPLAAVEKHILMKKTTEEKINTKYMSKKKIKELKLKRLKKIANLRFKGTLNGKFQSEKLYEDIVEPEKKKRKSIKAEEEEDESYLDDFKSIAPVQYSEFDLQDKVNIMSDHVTSIKFKLSGTDVFAGLHELSVLTEDESLMILNPEEIPDWLTGEENSTSGIVRNGRFINK
ncbi:unnamed protein product [Candida verbasci]|uniref:Uncharacterized protein n=1 Tax=Candida verbasci TaxID=1227364 RepID=A0A9W4XG72_9ASCO|nr:unnamed protein product [Candida verbasci]